MCLDALGPKDTHYDTNMFANSLSCPNGHHVCTACVAKLARPTGRCNEECSGLNYQCPLCRQVSCISNIHMLVLLKGSWQDALRCFDCAHECRAWNRGEDDDSTATTEEASTEEEDVP